MGSKPQSSNKGNSNNANFNSSNTNTNNTNKVIPPKKESQHPEVELTFINTQPDIKQIQNIQGPKTYKEYFSKGNYLFQHRNWSESYVNYSKSTELNKKKSSTYIDSTYGKIRCLALMNRIQEAKEDFSKLLQEFPKDMSVLINNGLFHYDINEPEDAVELFDKVIELEPLYALAYCYKAMALVKMSKVAEALECLEKAIDFEDSNLEFYVRKALLLTEKGYEEESKATVKIIEDIILQNDIKKVYSKAELAKAKNALKTIRMFKAVALFEGAYSISSPVVENEVSANEMIVKAKKRGKDENGVGEGIEIKEGLISDEYGNKLSTIKEEKKTEENLEEEKGMKNEEMINSPPIEQEEIHKTETSLKELKERRNPQEKHTIEENQLPNTQQVEITNTIVPEKEQQTTHNKTPCQGLKENQNDNKEIEEKPKGIQIISEEEKEREEEEFQINQSLSNPIKVLKTTSASTITVIDYQSKLSSLACQKVYSLPSASALFEKKEEVSSRLNLNLQKILNNAHFPIIYSTKLLPEENAIEVIEEYCDEGDIISFFKESNLMFTETIELIGHLLDAFAFLIINEIPFDYNPKHILIINSNNSHLMKITMSSFKAIVYPELMTKLTKELLYDLLKEIMVIQKEEPNYVKSLNELIDNTFRPEANLDLIEVISELIPIFDPIKFLDE